MRNARHLPGNRARRHASPAALALAGVLAALAGAGAAGAQAVQPNPLSPLKSKKVLVLEGGSIDAAHLASRNATWANLQAMSSAVGFSMAKSDAKNLTDASLAQYDIIVFNYFWETNTETHFPTSSKNAFQAWLAKGKKGYVGYHTSGANEYSKNEWVWYQDNVTFMRYALHGAGTPQGIVDKTTDPAVANHPIMEGLPARFTANDEWYEYTTTSKLFDPAMGVKVMYNLSNAAAINRAPNPNHPVAWFREDPANKTRYFYATFVHGADGANSDWFKGILLRALEYTAGDPATPIVTMNGDAMVANRGFAYISNSRSLKVELPGDYALSVYSPSGSRVYSASGRGPRSFRPGAFAKAGLYTVRLEAGARTFSQRVMIY